MLPFVADLKGLRNQAVHGRDFTVDAAQTLEYIELAERAISALPPRKPLDEGPTGEQALAVDADKPRRSRAKFGISKNDP